MRLEIAQIPAAAQALPLDQEASCSLTDGSSAASYEFQIDAPRCVTLKELSRSGAAARYSLYDADGYFVARADSIGAPTYVPFAGRHVLKITPETAVSTVKPDTF
ncbi:MAG: hypothetical protein IPL70_00145 [Uliginosibacterium sp.]|nr:hypothetical protein [Uliginosibacterium sp.]